MSQLTIKQCFDIVGLLRDNDVPCDPNAEVSACCGTGGSQYIDNLHCINPQGGSVPDTCTFQSWVSGTEPACPCPPIYVGNETALDYRDGVTLCPDGGFVCGANNFDSCNRGHSMPIINYGLAGDDIPATSSVPDPTAVLSTYYAGLALSTQPISRATSSATSISASSTSSGSPSSSQPANASSSSSDSLSTGAKAGIAVGAAAIVILLIAFIAFFLVRRKKEQRRNQGAGSILAAQPYYDYHHHQQPPQQPPVRQYEKDAGRARQWQPPMELDSTNASSESGRQKYR